MLKLKFAQSSLFRNTLKLTSGTLVSYSIPIITTPILSRMYTPDDYGAWGVFSSYVVLLAVMTCGGYECAIVKARGRAEAYSLMGLSFCFNLVFCILILLILLFSTFLKWDYVNSISGRFYIPLFVFLSGCVAIYRNYANSVEKYNIYAFSQVLSGATQVFFRIAFSFLHFNNGLIMGSNGALFCDLSFLSLKLKVAKNIVRNASIVQFKKQMYANRKFPLFDVPSTLLNYSANSLPVIILASFFSPGVVGCFTMMVQLLLIPMAFVGSAMGNVFYKQIASSIDEQNIATVSSSVFKVSFLLGLLPISFLVIGGDYFIDFFLGSQWVTARPLAFLLSLWVLPTIMFAPLLPIYRVKNSQNVLMIYMAITFVLRILTVYLGIYFSFDFLNIVYLYSVFSAIIVFVQGYFTLKLCNLTCSVVNKKFYFLLIIVIILWIVKSLNIKWDLNYY